MFSISDNEFRTLLYEYSKINPYTNSRHLILEPYPIIVSSLLDKICLNDENQLKYEAGVMAYLLVKTKTPASSGGSGKLKAISPKGTTLC